MSARIKIGARRLVARQVSKPWVYAGNSDWMRSRSA